MTDKLTLEDILNKYIMMDTHLMVYIFSRIMPIKIILGNNIYLKKDGALKLRERKYVYK